MIPAHRALKAPRKPGCNMFRTLIREFIADETATGLFTGAAAGKIVRDARTLSASARWSFHRRGSMCGYVRIRAGISRPWPGPRAAAGNIGYHSEWRKTRDESKYHRVIDSHGFYRRFAAPCGGICASPGWGREKVIACVIKLLEATRIRVGNEEYAGQNHSYD